MTTRIGLISDIHAAPAPLEQALSDLQAAGVNQIFCLGDIAGYGDALEQTVRLLQKNNCQCILGNHELWYLERNVDESDSGFIKAYFEQLPHYIEFEAEGRRIYLVHASPPDLSTGGIRLLDEYGTLLQQEQQQWSQQLAQFDYDALIVGHTHQVFAERLGSTLVINPGSTVYNHSCAVLNLPAMTVEWLPLSGRSIRKAWNWGMNVNRAGLNGRTDDE